jgi:hypothetical protein
MAVTSITLPLAYSETINPAAASWYTLGADFTSAAPRDPTELASTLKAGLGQNMDLVYLKLYTSDGMLWHLDTGFTPKAATLSVQQWSTIIDWLAKYAVPVLATFGGLNLLGLFTGSGSSSSGSSIGNILGLVQSIIPLMVMMMVMNLMSGMTGSFGGQR